MATVSLNGITFKGAEISINKGRIIIDGKDVTPDAKEITIAVDGNIERLQVDQCKKVTVNGSCGSLSTMSGNVDCGPVNGPVKTMSGNVKCGNVGNDVGTSSGDVDCGVIGGSVTTSSGDIDHCIVSSDKAFADYIAKHAPHLIEDFEREAKQHA